MQAPSSKQSSPRFYFVPLARDCLPECRHCFSLGCRNSQDRDFISVAKLIERAQAGGFAAMLFSPSLLVHPEAAGILLACRQRGLKSIVQLSWHSFSARQAEWRKWRELGLHLNLVLHGIERVNANVLENLVAQDPETHFTIMPTEISATLDFLRQIPPTLWERIYFQFPPYLPGSSILTVRQVARLVESIRKIFPAMPVRPPLGREVWDPRIAPELSLESDAAPEISYSIGKNRPEFSVVIPAFNSGPLLKNCLRHLLWQEISRERFEIIVVDDGSTDGSLDLIRNFMAPEAGRVNFKYIYFPRARARSRGDGNFRAGIARNLGVKHAAGSILVFIDSDIIVPSHYLEDLGEKHKVWDVIQCVRLHLKSKKQNELVEYKEVQQSRDTYILEKNYWGPFFSTARWAHMKFFWKYTCTYGLSVKAEDFRRAGWFRRTFVYYGFEDTDLGYRLASLGLKFFLNRTVTYHLASEEDRSEYGQSALQRRLLLAKTAKVFFLNTLDLAVFEHFGGFMENERPLLERIGLLKRKKSEPILAASGAGAHEARG